MCQAVVCVTRVLASIQFSRAGLDTVSPTSEQQTLSVPPPHHHCHLDAWGGALSSHASPPAAPPPGPLLCGDALIRFKDLPRLLLLPAYHCRFPYQSVACTAAEFSLYQFHVHVLSMLQSVPSIYQILVLILYLPLPVPCAQSVPSIYQFHVLNLYPPYTTSSMFSVTTYFQ